MYTKIIKRTLDIVISFIFMPIVIILAIPISVAIKLEDQGPVFFNGLRLGRNQKEFQMFKFRTMKQNAPDIRNSDGSTFNSSDDDRVTKVGKYLRKSSIDEIPQILNVFLGSMSFVGPRPSPLGNQDKYSKEYLRKFDVKPGITGLNQALLRNNATHKEREYNDLYYVNNISFALDIKIVWLTIISVLKAKNINRN